MSTVGIGPSGAMFAAMAELWRLRPPGPDNIIAHPAYLRLREVCRDDYSTPGPLALVVALSTALRALGLPCHLHHDKAHLALPVEDAAKRLDAAFRATHTTRIHLAPLDLADDLPPLAFGSSRLYRPTADELHALVDAPRLKRLYPGEEFDAKRFSEFHWLIVEETLPLDRKLEARVLPFLCEDMGQDLGRIEPHEGRYPAAFSDALFFLLLAPWESWSTTHEFDWRGFRIPWVYTTDSDLFVRLPSPPSPDTLSWREHIYYDGNGEPHEVERPIALQLETNAATELRVWNQRQWEIVERAKRSPLFETPIAHFLVRAFLAEGVDEFLAHITTIEAALGLSTDYQPNSRGATGLHRKLSPTKRLRARIAGILNSRDYAEQYEDLFNVRSAFLHGRAMKPISTAEQVMARSLARQVVEALIMVSQSGSIPARAEFLDALLDKGASLL